MAASRKASAMPLRAACLRPGRAIAQPSLADFLLPTTLEMPHIDLAHTVTRRRSIRSVSKAGEAGAIPVSRPRRRSKTRSGCRRKKSSSIKSLSPGRLFELDGQIPIDAAMILVTSAAGKTAGRDRGAGGERRRARLHTDPNVQIAHDTGATEVDISGFEDPRALARAAAGRRRSITSAPMSAATRLPTRVP